MSACQRLLGAVRAAEHEFAAPPTFKINSQVNFTQKFAKIGKL
jgi:hypothetical protein